MAKSFSAKQYFKKIYSSQLLTEFYEKHSIQALFEITEQTPRKNAVALFTDFYTSLSPEEKYDCSRDLALVESISTEHATFLFEQVIAEKKLSPETLVECYSHHDRALYYFLYHKDCFEEVLFFHSFYKQPSYMLYEAKERQLLEAELAVPELSREFTRIANKEERVTECLTEAKSLGGILYIRALFDGDSSLVVKRDSATGEVERTTTKKLEEVRVAYIPKQQEVLIAFTGSKKDKLFFLDAFLRIVCKDSYQEKIETFDLAPCKEASFDFMKTNKGVPLISWKVTAVTFSFGEHGGARKKVKLNIPSQKQEQGMSPLFSSLQELGIMGNLSSYTLETLTFAFSFHNKRDENKSVRVLTTLSPTKSSLCPLFLYHNYARSLLTSSGVRLGFVEKEEK